MIDSKKLQNLLQADMTREQFLRAGIAALFGIVGLTAFIKNMDAFTQNRTKPTSQTGYGKSPYGR